MTPLTQCTSLSAGEHFHFPLTRDFWTFCPLDSSCPLASASALLCEAPLCDFARSCPVISHLLLPWHCSVSCFHKYLNSSFDTVLLYAPQRLWQKRTSGAVETVYQPTVIPVWQLLLLLWWVGFMFYFFNKVDVYLCLSLSTHQSLQTISNWISFWLWTGQSCVIKG